MFLQINQYFASKLDNCAPLVYNNYTFGAQTCQRMAVFLKKNRILFEECAKYCRGKK